MSTYLKRRKRRIILHYAISWTVAFLLLSFVRGYRTVELGKLEFDAIPSLIISITLGPLLGTLSGWAQLYMEDRFYRRITVYKFLIWRLVYTVFLIILLAILSYSIYSTFFGTDIGLVEFAMSDGAPAIYLYVLVVDLIINFTRQINMMLGEGNLSKLLRGKFYDPSEEKRIFMFLDLRSSTSIAEKLGHIKYSSFIQDCFNDLTTVIEFGAQIHQYVGDEAVLTWSYTEGIKDGNCLMAFFAYKRVLNSKSDYYLSEYGMVPEFKAGIHGGMITVTEIGKYKREIAFHGDTINTAARIAGKCNELGQELLISNVLANECDLTKFELQDAGDIKLRGKQDAMRISGVRLSP